MDQKTKQRATANKFRKIEQWKKSTNGRIKN